MTTYEKFTIAISSLALFTAFLTAIFRDDISAFFKGNRAHVTIEKRIDFGQRLGIITFAPYISISNEGGEVLKPAKGEVELVFEKGNKIKLVADSFRATDSDWTPLRLIDVSVKPGNTWSGRLIFNENISQNDQEGLEKLEYEARSSSYQKLVTFEEKSRNLLTKFASLFEEDAKKNAPRIATLANGIEFRMRYDPDEEILVRARKLFDANISRIEKGDHTMVFKLLGADGRLIQEKRFRFTFYESQLQNLRSLFDEFGSTYVTGIFPPPRIPVSVVLKDGP